MKKFLMALLSVLLVISNTNFINAEEIAADENEIILETEQLDPNTLHVEKIGEVDESYEPVEEALPYRLSDIVRVSIVLEESSTLDAGYSAENIAFNQSAMNYRDGLKARQDEITREIEAVINEELDVKWNMTLAVNIISANMKYGDIVKVRNIPGIKNVFIENQYEAQVDEINTSNSSSGMVGATAAWASGYNGAGQRIAIIDTGIDTTHQSFNADAFNKAISEDGDVSLFTSSTLNSLKSELNGSGTYVSSKIPYGYNYVDNNTTINHLSDTQGEHGSHVAGIASANRYIKNGSSYDVAADTVKAVGMAPDAQLFIMKVFGSGGGAYDSDYMVAIEDAIVLGCDAVNLSLGSSVQGFTYSSEYQEVLNNLSNPEHNSNMVVTISAGNSYALTQFLETDLYVDDVGMHTGGSPGTFINSLCTASVDNIGYTGTPLTVNGKNIFYTDTGSTAMSSIAGTYNYVYIDAVGNSADYSTVNSAASLSGKIVIVNRGEINFSDKGNNAKSYSPKAVIVANNQGGTISMDLSAFTGSFPMVSITLADANYIKENSTKKTTGSYTYYTGSVTVTNQVTSGIAIDRADAVMSDFSSWGVPGSLIMKPEIAAPGGDIYSVFGTNKTTTGTAGGSTQYELMSGTSMAAPHMAGLSALVAEYVKENDIAIDGYSSREIIQSLLMSTATPMINNGEYVSILQQGSGLVDASKAVKAPSVIMMGQNDATLTALTGAAADGKVKAELGDNPNRTDSKSFTFTIYNLNDSDDTYELKTDLFTQDNYTEENEIFMSQATKASLMDGWQVDYRWFDVEETGHDVNGDGSTDDLDVTAILDYVTEFAATEAYSGTINTDAADLDGDQKITSYDAKQLIDWITNQKTYADGVVPANGSRKVEVTITPDQSKTLDQIYTDGAYVEGYTYATSSVTTEEGELIEVSHSIPILGYYGSWTDPSMFDNTSYPDTLNGTAKTPYTGVSDTNYLTISSNGKTQKVAGNPFKPEDVFPADKLAINSDAQIVNAAYSLVRAAGTTGAAISKLNADGDVSNVLFSTVTGNNVYGIYYSQTSAAWQNKSMKTYSFNKALSTYGLTEGDQIRVGFYAIPEYNAMNQKKSYTASDSGVLGSADFESLLKTNVLGDGAFVGYDFTIDDTAPSVSQASLAGNTLSVQASDNQELAYVAVLSLDGNTVYAEAIPGTSEYTISFDAAEAIANANGYVAVFAGDYAGNEAAVAVKVNDNMSSEKTVYVQTSTLTAGNDYLIVNTNAAGTGYALGHSGTTASRDEVTIKAGTSSTQNAAYIESKDVDSTSVWTAASGYTFKNGSYYIGRSNGGFSTSLRISTSSTNWTWNGANNLLSANNRYLTYSGSSFTLSSSSSSVYLFEKQTITAEVDPYTVDSISISDETLDLYKGNTADLVAKVSPLTAAQAVTWTTSNASVAAVDENGHVTATGGGSAVITVAANSNSDISASCTVTVISVNKSLNAIVWDEEGGEYFSGFNANSLPAWTRNHSDAKSLQLASAFMADASNLYAGTLDMDGQSTVLYKVNRSTYDLTEYGTNYVMAFDTARASTNYTGYFVYGFAGYLIFGNLAPEEDSDAGGTFSGLPYGILDLSETSVGSDIYVAGIAARSIGSSSSSFYFLDETGKIWQTTLTMSNSSISFGTPSLVVDTGIGTSFLYQNLYYDGTYLYWAHTDGSAAELLIINPSTKAIYHAGNFGEGVWPVSGMYVNGSAAPASEEETLEVAEPLELTKQISREELMNESVMNRISAEAARMNGIQTAGSLNSIKNHVVSERKAVRSDAMISAMNKTKAETTETEDTVSITLSEEETVNNGLYKITYDPSKTSYVSDTSSAGYKSTYVNAETGIVCFSFADAEGINANEAIDQMNFTAPEQTAEVTVSAVEKNADLSVNTSETIQLGVAEYEAIHLAGNSLSLEGDIGVNFFLNIPEETAEAATVKLQFRNNVTEYVIKEMTPTENGYKITGRAAAKEMREPFIIWAEDETGRRIQLLSASGKTDYTTSGYSYTVEKYFNLARTHSDQYGKILGVVEAMDTYGKYAQTYFEYEGYENLTLPEVSDVTLDIIEGYKIVKSTDDNLPEGLGYGGSNLTLETVTSYSHFFTVEEGKDISAYEFRLDGSEITPVYDSGSGMYRVKVDNIAAKDLDKTKTLTVTGGGKEYFITYSALSYARTAIKNNLDTANLCRAMYKYFDAVDTYFSNLQLK